MASGKTFLIVGELVGVLYQCQVRWHDQKTIPLKIGAWYN
jgi:hypothetical protein